MGQNGGEDEELLGGEEKKLIHDGATCGPNEVVKKEGRRRYKK